jgi:hypothetical protein
MATLLHIDSSPLYGRSVSRQLTGAFVAQWKSSHMDGTVIDRDLNATAISPITAEWVGAAYAPEEARTAQQRELLAVSDVLLAELEQADEYVIGVPGNSKKYHFASCCLLFRGSRRSWPKLIDNFSEAIQTAAVAELNLVAGLQCQFCERLCESSRSDGSDFHALSFPRWAFE